MSGNDWLEANNRYLAASLQWLRLRLQRLAEPASAAPPPTPAAAPAIVLPAPSATKRPWYRLGDAPTATATATPALASTASAATPAQTAPALVPPATPSLEAAAAERAAAAAGEPPPALPLLAERLGLSAFEADTLLLCAAVELDPGIAGLVAAAQGHASRSFPTFALALQLFDAPSWDALSPHRPLRWARLLELSQPGATPLTAAALRADERIVHYLKGLNAIDERLAVLLEPDEGEDEAPLLAPSQQAVVDDAWQRLQAAAPAQRVPPLLLLGADAPSKRELARALAERAGRHLYRLQLDALPAAETETLARLWQREGLLLPVALYLDAEALDRAPPELAAALHAFVARQSGLVFVGLREPPAKAWANAVSVDVQRPNAAEQHEAWRAALQGAPGADAERAAATLAGQFDLDLHALRQAAAQARPDEGGDVLRRAWAACGAATRPRLDQLAERIEPRAGWADLVLADEAMQLLHRIADQVRQRYRVHEEWGYAQRMNRGLGISALFAGESGTGKTTAAEVIAAELELALYRIDLSAVVSKYIGETEKNLRRLFDAAEQGGAILFFDEADALFGKRSEVKESLDRFANIEINYLLQRMEAFSGLAILATNMKNALDPAFLRRLRFVVEFRYPGVAERRRMWQQALPAAVPRSAAIDYDRLARFALAGGNIHGAALQAAFIAAAKDGEVTQAALLAAVRAELRKLDKPVHEGDFR